MRGSSNREVSHEPIANNAASKLLLLQLASDLQCRILPHRSLFWPLELFLVFCLLLSMYFRFIKQHSVLDFCFVSLF